MIRYTGGYKYQLKEGYGISTPIKPVNPIKTDFLELTTRGELSIGKGYSWDGPSGPVIDTKSNIRAALVHDALYQLMRMNLLNGYTYKGKADQVFMILCIEDGVASWIAKTYFTGLKWFGRAATLPKNAKKVMEAP